VQRYVICVCHLMCIMIPFRGFSFCLYRPPRTGAFDAKSLPKKEVKHLKGGIHKYLEEYRHGDGFVERSQFCVRWERAASAEETIETDPHDIVVEWCIAATMLLTASIRIASARYVAKQHWFPKRRFSSTG
jgi:hypothetical protein